MFDQDQAEAEAQIGRRLNELADRYSGSLKRSKGENELRADIRKQIEELGYSAEAFQPAVAIARTKRKSEADHYLESLKFFANELIGRQRELFPDDAERLNKRAEREAAKAAGQPRSEEELNAQTDSNPRSDPNTGGAATQTEANSSGAETHNAVDNSADEQAEGEQVFAKQMPESQSAQAARKREAAMNKTRMAAVN